MNRRILLLTFASVLAQAASPDQLERAFARVGKVPGGQAGVTVVHIESGRRVSFNGGAAFPMASTFKVPVAIQLLTLVDEGKERLDRMVEFGPTDLSPGSGIISNLFSKPGAAMSLRNLVELMLLISDNSATDMLVREVGGPQAINARLAKLDIAGIRIDDDCMQLIAGYRGFALSKRVTEAEFRQSFAAVTPAAQTAALETFLADPRNTAQPQAMAALLDRLYRGQLLSPASTALLLDILARCQTGDARVKGILPAGTTVGHKTGSMGGATGATVTNDVGIMTLPNGAGHLAIAAFVKGTPAPLADRERVVAEFARAAHDFFLFDAAPEAALAAAFERSAKAFPGQAGVSVRHVESGRSASWRGGEAFYAASTRKIPIAIQILARIDEGQERMDRMVTIAPRDLSPGSSTMYQLVNKSGLALSIRNLMELMLLVSDNSATDILLREAGGPTAVMARMAKLNLRGVRVDRPTAVSTAAFAGLDKLPDDHSPEVLNPLLAAIPPATRKAAAERFLTGEQDTATPDGMAELLVQLKAGKLLSTASTAHLLDVMTRCQTGDQRIKGRLPAGTVVAHKTGSLSPTVWIVNDVGIVTLPEGRGHLVVSAFTKGGPGASAAEQVIADFARSAYGYFVFEGGR
ncbi:MAG: class A beta-lactamase [Acidobacteria bacterium]|nr:class A beta-lactamase [Acidobacteriota bacterium]